MGNEFTVAKGSAPQIAIAADGSFVIAWEANGIWFQRFTPGGLPIGQPSQVTLSGRGPAVEMAEDGRFAIAWTAADGDGDGIFVHRLNPDGSLAGDILWANRGVPGSQSLVSLGIRDDGNLAVTWTESGGEKIRWISWNAPEEDLPYGPRIRSLSPAQPVPGPVTSFSVTFDRIMDDSSFQPSDVVLIDPVGRSISVDSVTTTDKKTFTVHFPAQGVPGTYKVKIGPDVRDLINRPMDQDGDAVNGESTDVFQGTFQETSLAANFPFSEGFKAGSIDSLQKCWGFTTTGAPISVTSGGSPHGRTYHLSMGGSGKNENTEQEAILFLDLAAQAGATDLTLGFWIQRYPMFTTFRVPRLEN
jgi:hypothetical protein